MQDNEDDLVLHNAELAHAGVGPVPDKADPGQGDVGMVERENEEEGNDGDVDAAEDKDKGEDKDEDAEEDEDEDEGEDEDMGSQGKARY